MRDFLNDFGLFLLRVTFGATMAAHGLQNVFVKGAESGIAFYTKVGIPNPEIMYWVGSVTEILGGVALVLGILARLAGLGTAIVMGGAMYYVHLNNGFFAQNKGYEYVLILAVIGATILLCGPGRWSVDYFLFGRRGKKTTGADTFVVEPVGTDTTLITPATTTSLGTTTATTTTNPSTTGGTGSVTL